MYPNPTLDNLVNVEEGTMNPQVRQAAFTAASKIVKDEAPYIFLYQKELFLAMRSNVDWSTNATGIMSMYSATKK